MYSTKMKASSIIVFVMVLSAVMAVDLSRTRFNKKRYTAHTTYDYEYPRQYRFAYDVKDGPSYNDFGHSETSDGKIVTGTYYVVLPDGRKQTVNYKVDAYSGYVADVQYEGVAKYSSYAPVAYKPVYSANEASAAYNRVTTPYYRPASVKADDAPTPVYKVSYQPPPPPAQKVKEEEKVAVENVEPVIVVHKADVAKVAAAVETAPEVKEKATTTQKVEWTEQIKAEETPANVEVVPVTEVIPAEADHTTEATVVPVKTEALTEKAEWTKPATTTESTKANNKRSYQRSWISRSQPRYYADRIRKRHPVAKNSH